MKIKPQTTAAKKLLIEYRDQLRAEVLSLREQACVLASKVREIDQIITLEDESEVAEADAVIEAWTSKSPEQLAKAS